MMAFVLYMSSVKLYIQIHKHKIREVIMEEEIVSSAGLVG